MSYRKDNGANYDHTLLSSVPDPTRAEKQEGYNIDLLDEGRDRRVPTPPNDGRTSEHHGGSSTLGYSPGAQGRKEETTALNGLEPIATKVPWYRRRRGIIIIAIAVLVLIGAIVGGVVGGTQSGKKSNNNNNNNNTTSANNGTSGPDQQGQGTGVFTSKAQSSSSSAGVGTQAQGLPNTASSTGFGGFPSGVASSVVSGPLASST